jgi:hypothetical protein
MNRLPRVCLISKSVSHYQHTQTAKILNDVKRTKVDNNSILQSINEKMSIEPQSGQRFIIIVDGSRYEIEICDHIGNTTILMQHFLHYNGKTLVPVNRRKVIIEWEE